MSEELKAQSTVVDGHEVQYRWAPGRDVEIWDIHRGGWVKHTGTADIVHDLNDAEAVAVHLARGLGVA